MAGPALDTAARAEERTRTLRLIDFLADYDAQRNPPVHDIAAYGMYLLRDTELPTVPGVTLSPAAPAWLSVDFLDSPPRPEVPGELTGLLGESATISPYERPVVQTAGDVADVADPGQPPSPGLVTAAERWVTSVWEPFAARWAEVAAAKALHRDLFQQRELLAANRESLELVWGFGRLRWQHDGVVADHPLVCVPVEVEQDPATQRIRVCPAGPSEVQARCLAGLSLADRAGFMSVRQAVADEDADLWDPEAAQDLLRKLIRTIDHDGLVVEHAPAPAGAAVTDRSWVLYLRRRMPDYQGFLERMRALYRDESVAVPDTLRAVVSDAPSTLAAPDAGDRGGGQAAEPLLLPLPTNEQQQRILAQAQHSTGVTVQGPPGTGKSHTIANIISHYVAYGQRVLVVAEKEQALRALAGKIPAGIKALAVGMLGADAASRRELEASIRSIQAGVTGLDRRQADEEIRRLTEDLDEVNRTIARTTQDLLATREAEVGRLAGTWIAGETPTRAEAARWVAAHQHELGYVDDLITPGTPPPLTAGELADFVALVDRLGVERAEACARGLPDLAAVPLAGDLAARFADLDRLRDSARALREAVGDEDRVVSCGRPGLDKLATRCRAQAEWLTKTAGSWISVVRDQTDDPSLVGDWKSFGARLHQDREEALRLRGGLTSHDVTIPDVIPPAFRDTLRTAHEKLTQTGRLGMFAGAAKRALQECSVDGRVPSTADDVDLCLQAIVLQDLRRRIRTSWRNQVERAGGPELSETAPEEALGRLLGDLARALGWPAEWARLRADLAGAGLLSPADGDAGTLGRLTEICVQAADLITLRETLHGLETLRGWLNDQAMSAGNSSPLWGQFADALFRADTLQWQSLRTELEGLHAIAPDARHLRELRQRLAGSAPIWTARIVAGPQAAGRPADFGAAWQWRQLDSWVRDGLTGPTPAQLQSRLEDLARERYRVVADLVTQRAWRWLADNLGDRQRQALNSYIKAVTRYGKTGGKFAQRWLTEIRIALDESKDAVPVWIMPTAQALTSFRPEAEPPFDVLVVDEASQISLASLPLLTLARKTIVVGDDKQTSPENVGLDRQRVFDLLEEYVAMIPKYRTLLDPDNSLYDIASQKFPDVVMLTEHFRCLPPIIAFSNAHAYDHAIVPLRDKPPRPGWAALGAVKVADGYRDGFVNKPEAAAVVDLVAGLCANPDYDGMNIGVISLLGSVQSKLIADLLYDRLGPEVIRQRRLRSGEPANFQGDERDIIVISAVAAVDPARPSGRISGMTGTAAMRRLNVAASRARQQMWVVYSAEPESFPDGDLRAALIRHCREAGAYTEPERNLLDACDSQFEKDVLQRIVARGYRKVSVQHRVGQYRIDIVVEGPRARLAVECDGDRWHGPDAWHRDRARQQVLERAGWTFERIRGSAFYRDPDLALEPLWRRLNELEIPAGDWWAQAAPQDNVREVSGLGRPAAADPPTVS